MSHSQLVSVIIPCWNGEKFISACLDSLLRQTYQNYEIIIVDNASPDGSTALINEMYSAFSVIRLIVNPRNLGFAGGVNVGLRAAQGDLLVLLNQDTVLREDWLQALVEGMHRRPATGIGGCKILDREWRRIYHAGGKLFWPQALPEHWGFNELDEGQYNQEQRVEYVTGAALAIKREVLETIGYLDERYFFYFEDVDYCYRAHQAGYEITYFPQAVLYHHGAGSLGGNSNEYFFRLHHARLWFVLNHKSLAWFVAELLPQELTWLKQPRNFNEQRGLRQAYAQLMFKLPEVINMPSHGNHQEAPKAEDDAQVIDVLQALQELQHQVRQEMDQTGKQAAKVEIPAKQPNLMPEDWWALREYTFTSNTPVIGRLITMFRKSWSQVASKWLALDLLHQQNRVNRQIVHDLNQLSQRISAQAEVLGDMDRELIRLTRQIAELSYHSYRPTE